MMRWLWKVIVIGIGDVSFYSLEEISMFEKLDRVYIYIHYYNITVSNLRACVLV